MSPVVTEGVQATLRDGGQRFLEEIANRSDLARGRSSPADTGDRLRLSRLRELLQVREVHPLATELDCVKTPAAGAPAFAASKVDGGGVDVAFARRVNLSMR